MKKLLKKKHNTKAALLFVITALLIISPINNFIAFAAEDDVIADANLKQALLDAGVDTSGDGEITQEEIGAITADLVFNDREISDLTGMEYATSLGGFSVSGNQITNIDSLSELTQLANLDVSNNYLDITSGSDAMAVINALKTAGCNVIYLPQATPEATPTPTPTATPEATPEATPVTGISLDKSEIELCKGDTETIVATITPSDATNKTVTWSSSNVGVATVSNGVVTGVEMGAVTITATAQDGNFVATCTAAVIPKKIATSIYSIDSTNSLLKNVLKNTTAADLKSNLINNVKNIKLYDQNGNEYTGDAVGTGMLIKLIVNDQIRDELTLAVLGDGNGDGKISITDYTQARLDILGLKSLTGAYKKASDINGDGKISITDYTLMRLDILGLKPVTSDSQYALPDALNPQVSAFLEVALQQCGDPYVWSAEGPNAFDCSGYVYYCLRAVGYYVPRTTANSYSQRSEWQYVSRENLQSGDLMFYRSETIPNHIGHIGIYLGDGYHVHASSDYGCVIICQMDGWYDRMFSHGMRVFQ